MRTHFTAERNPIPVAGRRAYTLVELVVAMAATSVLLAGMASAIFVAGRASDPGTLPANTIQGSMTAEEIAAELRLATSFTSRTATSVEFTVPDRDNDSAPETIEYVWSGTPAAPLQRTYNGGAVVEVLQNVHEFQFDYYVKTVTEQLPPSGNGNESAEILLAGYEGAVALADFSIDSNNWIGQFFQPSLPADALSWKVTRVQFQAKYRGKADGTTMVQLRPPVSGNLPGNAVLEVTTMLESTLSEFYAWQEFTFSNAAGLSPNQGLCLVLKWVNDAHSANIQHDTAGGSGELTTNDGGLPMTYQNGQSMLYRVYGTITTPDPPETVDHYFLTRIGMALRVGADTASRIDTAVGILNAPEVSAP